MDLKINEPAKEGWKCPNCQTVWAPTVKSCESCTVQESKKETRQLLTETIAYGM